MVREPASFDRYNVRGTRVVGPCFAGCVWSMLVRWRLYSITRSPRQSAATRS